MYVWSWAVTYDDGSYYAEEEIGTFSNVQIERVVQLIVFRTQQPSEHFVVRMSKDMRPIFFRRSKQVVDFTNEQQWNEYICTCFGWQKTVNGSNVKSMTWLFPDNSVAVTDRDIDELG